MPQERLVLRATMIAHDDWVTAIATPTDNSDVFVTSSHDKSLILWTVTKEDKTTWLPRRRLTGHSHFVEDVALSSDGKFALSGSWDGEVRLWDLQAGTTVRQFVGRTKDVWSVSRSQDKTVKIRYSGNCKIRDKLMGHGGYVNTVAVCPDGSLFASGGEDGVILLWDLQKGKMEYSLESNSIIHSLCFSSKKYMLCAATEAGIKVWDLASKRIVIDFSRTTLIGHRGYVNTVAVSPDGLLCASGGEDGEILFWDFLVGRKLHSLESNSRIHSLCFCPNKFWVCAATEVGIMIWDLESKNIVVDLRVPKQEGEMTAFGEQSTESKNKVVYCTSLSWSADGSTLFSGYTDGVIRVWAVVDC